MKFKEWLFEYEDDLLKIWKDQGKDGTFEGFCNDIYGIYSNEDLL